MKTGTCRYCGQVIDIGWVEGIEKYEYAEADYLASRFCSCPDGRKYNDLEIAREEAGERREFTLANAKAIIEELFGEGSRSVGEIVVDNNVRDLIYELAEIVYDTDLGRATLTDSHGITAKVKMSSKGRLSISRNENNSVTQEA